MRQNNSHENNLVSVCHLKEAEIQLWDDIRVSFCLPLWKDSLIPPWPQNGAVTQFGGMPKCQSNQLWGKMYLIYSLNAAAQHQEVHLSERYISWTSWTLSTPAIRVETLSPSSSSSTFLSLSFHRQPGKRMKMTAPPRGSTLNCRQKWWLMSTGFLISSFFQLPRPLLATAAEQHTDTAPMGVESRVSSFLQMRQQRRTKLGYLLQTVPRGGRLKKSSYFEPTLQPSRSTATPQHGTVM